MPVGLFRLIAILVKYEVITFESIWPHLSLINADTFKNELDEVENLINFQFKMIEYHY